MLEQIKLALRISHNALDTEIQSTISAALLDMGRVGINTSSNDALINKCVELYCKWNYDYLGKGENWQKAYDSLRNAMSMCGDYQ